MKKEDKYEYIVIMKVGPFCGYSLDEIIEIKKGEQQKTGKFYFGYRGVFCHPGKVLRFIEQAKKKGINSVKLLFLTTPSDFTSNLPRSKSISENGVEWAELHPEVLLVGSKFAFVAKDINPVDYELDLTQYRSMLGKRRGKYLNEHLKFRVDKSCAVLEPHEIEPVFVKVKYESELVFPYCVLVR